MRRLIFTGLIATFAFACGAAPAGARRRPAPAPSPSATPVPLPPPAPLGERARVERMHGELDAIARDAPGRLGVAVTDLASGEQYAIRGNDAFPLAGTSRVAVAIVAYRLADQRKLDLDRSVTITRGDVRRGPSDIAARHPGGGAAYALWQLVRAMLAADTTASDVVLRAIGGPGVVNATLARLGLRGFDIRTSEAERAADERSRRTFARGGDDAGTPNALAALLTGLATQRFTLLDATNELLLALEASAAGPDRLRAGAPAGVRLAHEAGTSATFDGITDATNDAGILTWPGGRRVVVVALLAESPADEATREATLARVARSVANAYTP